MTSSLNLNDIKNSPMPTDKKPARAKPVGSEKGLQDYLKLFAPALVVVLALGVMFWTFYFSEKQLESAAKSALAEMGGKILQKTAAFLKPAAISTDFNAVWLSTMYQHEGFAAGFHKTARQQMRHFPHFGLIYFGDTRGNHLSTKREPNGDIRFRITKRLDDTPTSHKTLQQAASLPRETPAHKKAIQKLIAPILKTSWHGLDATGRMVLQSEDALKIYDPRLRPWYIGAEARGDQSWTNVYTWETKFEGQVTHQAGITVSVPVFRQGQFIGVTAIDLVLQAISEFLEGLTISANGRAFIFDSMGLAVGLPNYSEVLKKVPGDGGKIQRVPINNTRDRAKRTAYAALKKRLGVAPGQKLSHFDKEILKFDSHGEHFLSFFQPLDPAYYLDWYVGILLPEEDIKGPLKKQFQFLLIAMTVVVLLLLSLIPLYLKLEKERRFIRNAFSKYVSPNRVDFLLKNPEQLSLGGEYRECSFVMTDLAGFTSLMEQLGDQVDPSLIVNTLNNYLEGMVQTAFAHEGTLDRIVGDAVAVLFSAPVNQPDHAERALACALEMSRFAEAFSKQCRAKGIPFGHTRVGVNSGRVLLGNFGGKTVFDYRALGDPINTAARLETVNDQIGTRICVSGATVARLPHFQGRPVGVLVLKGKEMGIKAYEPLTDEDFHSPLTTAYQAAFRLMADKNPGAETAFKKALEQWPDDALLMFHHNRLTQGQQGERILFFTK